MGALAESNFVNSAGAVRWYDVTMSNRTYPQRMGHTSRRTAKPDLQSQLRRSPLPRGGNPILIDETTTILAGHGHVEAAARLSMAEGALLCRWHAYAVPFLIFLVRSRHSCLVMIFGPKGFAPGPFEGDAR